HPVQVEFLFGEIRRVVVVRERTEGANRPNELLPAVDGAHSHGSSSCVRAQGSGSSPASVGLGERRFGPLTGPGGTAKVTFRRPDSGLAPGGSAEEARGGHDYVSNQVHPRRGPHSALLVQHRRRPAGATGAR